MSAATLPVAIVAIVVSVLASFWSAAFSYTARWHAWQAMINRNGGCAGRRPRLVRMCDNVLYYLRMRI